MFPDTGANTSSGRGSGQVESAGAAVGSGASGAPSPGRGESCKKSSSVPAAAEGDGEEDEEEAAAAAAKTPILWTRSMLATGLGMVGLAVLLFHLGQQKPPPEEEEEEVGGQLYVAWLLLRLVLYLVCAVGAFLLGLLLALGSQSRGRLRPPPGFLAAWKRRYLGRASAASFWRSAGVSDCLSLTSVVFSSQPRHFSTRGWWFPSPSFGNRVEFKPGSILAQPSFGSKCLESLKQASSHHRPPICYLSSALGIRGLQVFWAFGKSLLPDIKALLHLLQRIIFTFFTFLREKWEEGM